MSLFQVIFNPTSNLRQQFRSYFIKIERECMNSFKVKEYDFINMRALGADCTRKLAFM